MPKILTYVIIVLWVLLILFCICTAVYLHGSPLVGSWTPQKSSTAPWGYPDVFTLKADGTGKCDGFEIYRWETRGNKLIIQTAYDYMEYEYKLSFGKLTLDGVPYEKS